ncbi:MAG: hypothetical protein OXT03_03905 [Alphaproteobacteria bacterium]|nr:hypothetical protein [Alphaproteobacteria bacterium]
MTNLTANYSRLHQFLKRGHYQAGGLVLLFALFMSALFVSTIIGTSFVLARENAKRAPLNIIPKANVKASSASRRAQETNAKASDLPQLAPNGATLRRPVRSVAALPGGQGAVQIGALGALEESEIGLIDGLGIAVWQKSRISSVSRILPRLPTHFELPASRGLGVSLMLSRATPPPGLHEGNSFFAQRLGYLLSLGETASVQALIEMTGAARRDPAVAQIAAEAALTQGDHIAACSHLGTLSRLSLSAPQKDFALQLRGFCQVKAGDFAAAGLTVDIARESGMKDALFMDLLFVLTANITPPHDFWPPKEALAQKAMTKNTVKMRYKDRGKERLTIMQAALLDLAGITIPPQQAVLVPSSFVSKFAKDPRQPIETRLLLAERGIAAGHIAPSYLLSLAQSVDLATSPPLIENAMNENVTSENALNENVMSENAMNGNVTSENETAPISPIIERARQLRLIDEVVTPKGQIEILQSLLKNGLVADKWPVVVQTTAPYLRRLTPDLSNHTTTDFVTYIVPALIWLGEYERAQTWLDILMTQQGGLPSARGRNLQGLIRLVSELAEGQLEQELGQDMVRAKTPVASDESPAIRGLPPMEVSLIGAVLETGAPYEVAYIRSEIALLPLFNYNVPPFLTEAVASEIKDKTLARMLDEMEAALAKARRGDVIVLALIGLEYQAYQGNYHMGALRRILTSLKTIGLVKQAQAIARDLLVLQASHLGGAVSP